MPGGPALTAWKTRIVRTWVSSFCRGKYPSTESKPSSTVSDSIVGGGDTEFGLLGAIESEENIVRLVSSSSSYVSTISDGQLTRLRRKLTEKMKV